MDWIPVGFTLTASFLIARKHRSGWLVAMIAQSIWILVGIHLHTYGMATMSAILLCQAIYGYYYWSKWESGNRATLPSGNHHANRTEISSDH